MKRYSFSLVAVLIIGLNGILAFAAESGSNDAVVTAIQGSARIYAKGNTTGLLLKKGDTLARDSEVKVSEKSRIEIRFPDGTIMRLSEKSRWRMDELAYNKQTNEKKIKVGLSSGKLWANVRKLTSPSSAVEVRTSNAVAGVRGTEYRINVNDDKSVLVKVYDGAVYVANPPRDASKSIDKATMPHEVPGPHVVPPPAHEVSMEEWTVIVKAMQQVTVSPQGVASKPEDFDARTDADDWVRWNQERDKEAQL